MGDNVDLARGLIEVGGGAAAGVRDAAALLAGEAVITSPPEVLAAGDVGGPRAVPGNNAEGEAHLGPAPPAGLDAILHHLQATVAGQDALGSAFLRSSRYKSSSRHSYSSHSRSPTPPTHASNPQGAYSREGSLY